MPSVTHELPQLGKVFWPAEVFRQGSGESYALFPFRFLRLDRNRYIATNFVGEYIVLPAEDLKALIRHQLPLHCGIYDELKAKHFLFDGDSQVALDLLACKYRTKQSALPQLTSLFLFVVTLRCEHHCPYCQVSRQSENRHAFDMTEAHAERAIEFLFASPANELKVEFQGGEPLLNFELVRWIVERVKQRNVSEGRNIAFVIATNLAILTDEVLDFCREHQVALSTSLDGPRKLHNQNRPRAGNDSYERTVAAIERVRKKLGSDAISALMTTTRESLSQPEAIVDEYVRQGFHSIFLRWLSPFGFAVKTGVINGYSVEEWLCFYKQALAHIIQLNRAGTAIREEYSALLLRKMLTPFPTSYVDLQSPAGIGISCLTFNYDGSIYASDEARMLAEMDDDSFRLGHLATDSFQDIVTSDKLLACLEATLTESMPMCADCGVQPYCGSDPIYHHVTQGDSVSYKPMSGFCQKNMEIAKHLISLMEDDPIAAKILRSWIQ